MDQRKPHGTEVSAVWYTRLVVSRMLSTPYLRPEITILRAMRKPTSDGRSGTEGGEAISYVILANDRSLEKTPSQGVHAQGVERL